MTLACYLAIPVAVIGGVALSRLIDPEMARGTADYAGNFRLLQQAATAVVVATTGLAALLWVLTCYLVLESRQRSLLWLALAAAGPLGFAFIAMLSDRSPSPHGPYQKFIDDLKWCWRVPLEIAVFFSAWTLAYQCVALKRELSIGFESFSTGTPVETIVAQQTASSGMYAFGEGLEAAYLFTLIYLLWPVFFDLAGRRLKRRASPAH